jgi:hypothetical protein
VLKIVYTQNEHELLPLSTKHTKKLKKVHRGYAYSSKRENLATYSRLVAHKIVACSTLLLP